MPLSSSFDRDGLFMYVHSQQIGFALILHHAEKFPSVSLIETG